MERVEVPVAVWVGDQDGVVVMLCVIAWGAVEVLVVVGLTVRDHEPLAEAVWVTDGVPLGEADGRGVVEGVVEAEREGVWDGVGLAEMDGCRLWVGLADPEVVADWVGLGLAALDSGRLPVDSPKVGVSWQTKAQETFSQPQNTSTHPFGVCTGQV